MSIVKRTLQELVARYELHPDVCDIYVEGDGDKHFFHWFLEASGRQRVIVYPITEIDIPPDAFLPRGFKDGNRDRVVFLAMYLDENLGTNIRVTCIADSDSDHFLGIEKKYALLLLTDYTSIEMYAFSKDAVHKVARLLGCRISKSGEEILAELTPLLRALFFYRLTNEVLALGLHWIDTYKCCSVEKGVLLFKEGEFRKRYFNTKGLREPDKTRFAAKMEELRKRDSPEDRFCVRGRDFTEALAWYLAKSLPHPPHPDSKAVARMLLASLPLGEIAAYPLFRKLLERTERCR